jgi:hypothetical protein
LKWVERGKRMYLWKYWRESRIAFCVSLACIAILFAMVLGEPTLSTNGGPPLRMLTGIFSVALIIQVFPLAFVAWLFGSFGVGHDLGEKSGAYLFTRAATRRSFIWRDWSYGAVQLLVIVVLLNAVIGLQIYRILLAGGDPLHGKLPLASGPVSLVAFIALNCVAAFLLAALVFGLSYFSTVLVKHSKGVMLAVGIMLGYFILGAVVNHYWPSISFPSPILSEFGPSGPDLPKFADHLGAFVAIRAAVALLFPFAAQLVLEKADL